MTIFNPRKGFLTVDDILEINKIIGAIKLPHDFHKKVSSVSLTTVKKAKGTEHNYLTL